MRSRALGVVAALAAILGTSGCGGHSSPSSPSDTSEYKGICVGAAQSPYVLPYPVGDSYSIMQGYPPHNHDRVFRFAIDFAMPSRSVVTAAREGTVEFVEQGYDDGDSTSGHENVVTVDHGDGTFARYVHLVRNGALVRRGDRVSRGQQVGWSGRTGTPVVHLHFDVTTGCSERTCQTTAVCFSNTRPHPDGLQTGESYTANPY